MVLILQRFAGHGLHVFFFGKEIRTEEGQAKRTEKQEDGHDAKPLDAIYGLKQIFVHVVMV
jgi:hypothetical protein